MIPFVFFALLLVAASLVQVFRREGSWWFVLFSVTLASGLVGGLAWVSWLPAD